MIVSQNARTAEDERVGRARLKQNTDTKGSSSRPRSPAGSDADGYMAEDEEHPYDLSAPDGNGDDTTVLNGSYDDVYDDDKAWEDLTGQSYPWCHVWMDRVTGDVVETHGIDRVAAETILDPRGPSGAKEGAFIVRAAELHGRHSEHHHLTLSVVVCIAPRRAEVRHYPILRDHVTRLLCIATGPAGSAALSKARRFNTLADLVVYYTRNPISKPKTSDAAKPLLVPHRAPALRLGIHPLKRVAPVGFCDITFVL